MATSKAPQKPVKPQTQQDRENDALTKLSDIQQKINAKNSTQVPIKGDASSLMAGIKSKANGDIASLGMAGMSIGMSVMGMGNAAAMLGAAASATQMVPRVGAAKDITDALKGLPFGATLKIAEFEALLEAIKKKGKVVDGAAYDIYEYESIEDIMAQYDPELQKLLEKARINSDKWLPAKMNLNGGTAQEKYLAKRLNGLKLPWNQNKIDALWDACVDITVVNLTKQQIFCSGRISFFLVFYVAANALER